MARITFCLLVFVVGISGQNLDPRCLSSSNGTSPRPGVTNQYLPPGPPGMSCATLQEWKCDNSTCLYGFEGSSPICSCKCFDPCANKKCNGSEECIVMPAPHNLHYAMCIGKPDVCPKVFCNSPGCRRGYEVDSRGCPTCECKDPCKNFGCPKGYSCQLLLSASSLNSTLEPFCVACPKITCHKAGVCPNGLAKDQWGCDTCECQGCACAGNSDCFGLYCTGNFAMNVTTGCNICPCETLACSGKCSSDEACKKKYTSQGRVYGVCEKLVSCTEDCGSKLTSCPYGLKLDSNGCHLPGCPCSYPCQRMICGPNQVCKMSADDCPKDAEICRDAPMPYCYDCPTLEKCTIPMNGCPGGMAKDADGCNVCRCSGCPDPKDCPLHCSHGFTINATTGCQQCQCKLNPCMEQKCGDNETCMAVQSADGSYRAQCSPVVPVEPCQPTNCNTDCPMGYEKDSQGCILPGCTCFDWCKGFTCPPGSTCKLTPDDCTNTTECRDHHLRYCESTSTILSSTTTTATSPTTTTSKQCPSILCDPGCSTYTLPSNGCTDCNCTGVDPCKSHFCPAGSVCMVNKDACVDLSRCAGQPICILGPPTTASTTTTPTTIRTPVTPMATTTTTPFIVCTPPRCSGPGCQVVQKPGLPCPICECPASCQNIECPPGQTCQLVTLPFCDPPCTLTPICITSSSTSTASLPPTATRSSSTSTTAMMTTPKIRDQQCPSIVCDPRCSTYVDPSSGCNECNCTGVDLCKNFACPTNQTCRMLSYPNCFPPCPQLPKCVPSQPSFCSEPKDSGDLCIDAPVLQFRYNSTTSTCESFWFNGCAGNKNRFSSMLSCESVCGLQIYDCPAFACSLACHHGYKVDGLGCKKCECIDICEGVSCPSSNQQCRIQATPCPVDGIDNSGRVVPYCTSTEIAKCICKSTTCQVTCPLGKVKDSQGCPTCDCYDPCKSETCSSGQLCQVVDLQNCNSKSCQSNYMGSCLDAYLKKNIRMRVNASYEMYVLGDLDYLMSQMTNRLSSLFRVKRDFVSILKLEKGSILMTADVLYKTASDYAVDIDPDNFTIALNNEEFKASIVSSSDQIPLPRAPPSEEKFLTSGEIVLIVLLCLLVPLAIAGSVAVTYFACMRHKRSQGKMAIPSSSTLSSESLEQESKTGSSVLSIAIKTEGQKERPRSFTFA